MNQHEIAIASTVGKTVENFQSYQAYIKLDKYSFLMTTPSLTHDLDICHSLRQNETCFALGPAVSSIIKIHLKTNFHLYVLFSFHVCQNCILITTKTCVHL